MYQNAKPSAPILPRPLIRNTNSTSHQSKVVGCFTHIAPKRYFLDLIILLQIVDLIIHLKIQYFICFEYLNPLVKITFKFIPKKSFILVYVYLCKFCIQTFLTSKRWRYSDIFCTSNGICNSKHKCTFLNKNEYITFILHVYLYQIYCT